MKCFSPSRRNFRLEFRDKIIELFPGEFVIVPQAVEHRPIAEMEILLFEPKNVLNTGNITAEKFITPIGDKI